MNSAYFSVGKLKIPAHPRCKSLSNSRMTLNKENKRAMRPLNNNQAPARANEAKKKYHRFLHGGKLRIPRRVQFLCVIMNLGEDNPDDSEDEICENVLRVSAIISRLLFQVVYLQNVY